MSDTLQTPPDWLPDLIDVNGAPEEIFARLYVQYRLDFVDTGCYFQSAPVRCNNFKKAGEEYEEAFWHLVSREEYSTGERLLDARRAERLAWCAAVIANADDESVLTWAYLESNGKSRTYLWLPNWDYVVIMEQRKGTHWLITAFHVDKKKRFDLEGRYKRRER